MRQLPAVASSLLALLLCVPVVSAELPRADTPASPLRLLPDQADLLIQAPQPRRLVETLTRLDTLKLLRQLAPVRELYDSTNARRFMQLVAYFEKELGLPWPQLLDRLAGRGAFLGVQFRSSPTLLLVVEGEDARLMQQFFELGLQITEQELARQEVKAKPVKGSYKEYTIVHIFPELHAAVAGSSLLVSNSETALQAGLERHRHGGKKSMADVAGVQEAARLLPPQPLVSVWLNMQKVQQAAGVDARDEARPRANPVLTVFIGHYLKLLERTPFVCASVYSGAEGLAATIVIPRGREGLRGDRLLHVPPAGVPGSRPLLKPKNVLYSESAYFDLANIWKERATLFQDEQVRQLEKADKQATPFLLGTKPSKLLSHTGPYYRFVAAQQVSFSYKTTPKISLPAFALVWELRQPEAFGKAMEAVLRGVALLTGAKVDLQLVEEQYKDCKLVGYRFPENQPLKGDVDDLRFNFTPCFTRVGDQFVVSSTMALCRELVDLIHEEGSSPARGNASSALVRVYGSGVAAYLHTIEDLLITQTTLDQAVTPKEARQQVKVFLDVIRELGALSLEPRFDDRTFQYGIRLRREK
jgi:hypothetical protein